MFGTLPAPLVLTLITCWLAASKSSYVAPHPVSADCSQALGVVVQGTAVDDPEQQMTRKPDDKEPLAGLAFKIMADQFQVCPPPLSLLLSSFMLSLVHSSCQST